MFQYLLQHGAKIILPMVFQARGNTETLATHPREVHYCMAIIFPPMQVVHQHVWTDHIGLPLNVQGEACQGMCRT